MLCKLNKNINTDACPSLSHGIKSKVYLYNRDDISSVEFATNEHSLIDSKVRVDVSTRISTINASNSYFTVVGNVVTYNEQMNGDKYVHTLTITVNSKDYKIDEVLYHTKDNKYFVIFEPKGDNLGRCFGWGNNDEGAVISTALNLSETEDLYTITITQTTEYPLFSINKNAYDLSKMTFEGNYVPDFSKNIECLVDENGFNTGYVFAFTAPYVNMAGQALDSDGGLVEYTHRKQAAKTYNGQIIRPYEISGRYGKGDVVDGYNTIVYYPDLCSLPSEDSIILDKEVIEFYNDNKKDTVYLRSNAKWMLTNGGYIADVIPSKGDGNRTLNINAFDGGNETIEFTNTVTNAKAYLDIKSYTLNTNVDSLVISGAGTYRVDVTVKGGDYVGYMLTYDFKNVIVTNTFSNYFTFVLTENDVKEPSVITFTLNHRGKNEVKKVVKARILGSYTDPIWDIVSESCELDEQGNNNGYINYVYKDINPSSPSFEQSKTERIYNKVKCPTSSAEWELQNTFCETDERGAQTGYKVMIYLDVNPNSDSYGQTFMSKEISEDCPQSTKDPKWEVVARKCALIVYNHLMGNSGYEDVTYRDVNPYSDSYSEEYTERVYNIDACPRPNTRPIWEVMNEECEFVDGYRTGNIIYTDYNSNEYSDTFRETRTRIESDPSRCRPEYAYRFQVSDSDESVEINANINYAFSSYPQIDFLSMLQNTYQPFTAEITEGGDYLSNYYITSKEYESGTNARWYGYVKREEHEAAIPYQVELTQTASGKKCFIKGYLLGSAGYDGVWMDISSTCNVDADGENTGIASKKQRDINPVSPTYGQTRIALVTDEETCGSPYKFQVSEDDDATTLTISIGQDFIITKDVDFYSAERGYFKDFTVYSITTDFDYAECTYLGHSPIEDGDGVNARIMFSMELGAFGTATVKLIQNDSGQIFTIVFTRRVQAIGPSDGGIIK